MTYTANASGTVSVINPTTHAITTIQVADNAIAVAVDPGTGIVYTANYGYSGSVSAINPTTHAVTTITLGSGTEPDGIAVNPSTGTIYTTNYSAATVSVISVV